MKASDLFVKALEAEGVEYIFGIPGEENLDLLESLRTSSIKLVLTRHEQGAGFMAATYGRLTGKVGVCLSTLVTPAAYAQLGAMPMLMVTGQKPIKTSKQGRFQVIDIVDMMRPITKFTTQVVSGDRIPSVVREAFRLASEERPGAVHIELPEDIADEHTSVPLLTPSTSRRPIAEYKAISSAISMIEEATSPLLLIGAGANRKLTAKMLREFVDKTCIPFVTTQMGKGVLNESDPRFAGNTALSDNDFVHRAIERADLIINVGHDVVEKPPFFMHDNGKKVIHMNFESAAVDRDIRKVMPDDGIVTLDNGVYKIWFARNYPAYHPNTLLLDNALASMGAGLPSAIAAKLVKPDVPVMSVCGDGGFMMNSQEIETAVRLKLDLIVIILRDDAYGMIKWKQANMQFDEFGLDYGNPDFVKYAKSYGAHGWRVDSTELLIPMVESCLNTPGVHVIDCPVDYSMNDKTLNHTIAELSAKL